MSLKKRAKPIYLKLRAKILALIIYLIYIVKLNLCFFSSLKICKFWFRATINFLYIFQFHDFNSIYHFYDYLELLLLWQRSIRPVGKSVRLSIVRSWVQVPRGQFLNVIYFILRKKRYYIENHKIKFKMIISNKICKTLFKRTILILKRN